MVGMGRPTLTIVVMLAFDLFMHRRARDRLPRGGHLERRLDRRGAGLRAGAVGVSCSARCCSTPAGRWPSSTPRTSSPTATSWSVSCAASCRRPRTTTATGSSSGSPGAAPPPCSSSPSSPSRPPTSSSPSTPSPAGLAITTTTFLVWAANAFAVLGLRALYFCLAGLLARFVHLHYGLAFLLGFAGLKLILSETPVGKLPIPVTLAVIVATLAVSIASSLCATRGADRSQPAPTSDIRH